MHTLIYIYIYIHMGKGTVQKFGMRYVSASDPGRR